MANNKLLDELSVNLQKQQEIEVAITKQVKKFQDELATLKAKDAELRSAIKDAMEKNDVKKFENDYVVITYISPSVRMGLDIAKIKEEEPEVYKKYLKRSPIKSSIRLKVKEQE